LIYHGIQREIFAAPLAADAVEFLRGEVAAPSGYDWPARTLAEQFIKRWLLKRAEHVPSFCDFDRESYRLWPMRKGR
jgi:hypothetical protein